MVERVRLQVAGVELSRWKSLRITRSLENAAASFAFEAAPLPIRDRLTNPVVMRPGAACRVLIGDDAVVTGFIDDPKQKFDEAQHIFSPTGRSATGQVVDCSPVDVGSQLKGITLLAAAERLCAPYGIRVRSDVPLLEPIRRITVEPNDTVWAVIERAARAQHLVTDDVEGRLVLTRASAARRAVGGVRAGPGGNAIAGELSCDASKVYTEYVCRGQTVVADGQDAPVGRATDDSLSGLRRVRVIVPETSADAARCRVRAAWEAARRAGEATRGAYTLPGWRQTLGGPLWDTNLLVPVEDAIQGVSAEWLTVEVAFELGDKGPVTQLRLAPPSGYDDLAPARRTGKKATKGVRVWLSDDQVKALAKEKKP